MEESNTTITDSTTNRTIFFTVEGRSIQNLVDTVENKVSFFFIRLKNFQREEKKSKIIVYFIEVYTVRRRE
jgi:hypothetical protein